MFLKECLSFDSTSLSRSKVMFYAAAIGKKKESFLSSCHRICHTSNRNTTILLVLLFIVVVIIISVARSHKEQESFGGESGAPAPAPGPSGDSNWRKSHSIGHECNLTAVSQCDPASPPSPPSSPPFSQPPAPPPVLAPAPAPAPVPSLFEADLVVAADDTGNFTRIVDAVDSAPSNSDQKFYIRIKAGTYNESVFIPKEKTNLVIFGDGIDRTVLTFNHCAKDGWRTSSTATLVVSGDGFMARDLTIQNTAGPDGEQAVALLSQADQSVYYRCAIKGYQDTLYARHNRQFYRECDIYGTVDFIFGYASAVFQNCNLYGRRRSAENHTITFTAQGRDSLDDVSGFSFQNCTFAAEPPHTAGSVLDTFANSTAKTYLGRPWKMYSTTVVMQSYISDIVDREGWLPWNSTYNATLYYAEYGNRGPGASTVHRVNWPGFRIFNDSADAEQFTVSHLIDGDEWLPGTQVPYVGGLM